MLHSHNNTLDKHRATANHSRNDRLPCILLPTFQNIKQDPRRCFSGGGNDDSGSDSISFDRSKFTREVAVKMPDVGDGMEGATNFISALKSVRRFRASRGNSRIQFTSHCDQPIVNRDSVCPHGRVVAADNQLSLSCKCRQ